MSRVTCHVSSSAPVLCQKLVTGSPDRGPRSTWYSWPGDTWHAAASSHTEAGLIFDVEAGWRDESTEQMWNVWSVAGCDELWLISAEYRELWQLADGQTRPRHKLFTFTTSFNTNIHHLHLMFLYPCLCLLTAQVSYLSDVLFIFRAFILLRRRFWWFCFSGACDSSQL